MALQPVKEGGESPLSMRPFGAGPALIRVSGKVQRTPKIAQIHLSRREAIFKPLAPALQQAGWKEDLRLRRESYSCDDLVIKVSRGVL
jgi:hypothetical protein